MVCPRQSVEKENNMDCKRMKLVLKQIPSKFKIKNALNSKISKIIDMEKNEFINLPENIKEELYKIYCAIREEHYVYEERVLKRELKTFLQSKKNMRE